MIFKVLADYDKHERSDQWAVRLSYQDLQRHNHKSMDTLELKLFLFLSLFIYFFFFN